MAGNQLRSSKIMEIFEDDSNSSPIYLPRSPYPPRPYPDFVLRQVLREDSGVLYLYTVFPRTLIVANLTSGDMRSFRFDQDLLPLLCGDSSISNGECWAVTSTGIACLMDFSGLLHFEVLPCFPTSIDCFNGSLFVGDRNGSVHCVAGGKRVWTAVSDSSLISRLFNLSFSSSSEILSVCSNSTHLFFVSASSKLFVFEKSPLRRLSITSLSGSPSQSAKSVCTDSSLFISLAAKSGSVFKSFSVSNGALSPSFSILRPFIGDFSISEREVCLICGDSALPSIARHSLSDGHFVSSDWTPMDDFKFSESKLNANERLRPILSDRFERSSSTERLQPISVSFASNGFPVIGTSSAAFLLRPMTAVECISLKCDCSHFGDSENAILETIGSFPSQLPSRIWSSYVNGCVNGDIDASLGDCISKLGDLPMKLDFTSDDARIVCGLIPTSSCFSDLSKSDLTSQLWPSAVSQFIISELSYLLSSLLLFEKLYSDGRIDESSKSLFISPLLMVRRSIALIHEKCFESLRIFPHTSISLQHFDRDLVSEANIVFNAGLVGRSLYDDHHFSEAVAFLSHFEEQYCEFGLSLLEIGETEKGANFFIEHSESLQINGIYRRIIEKIERSHSNSLLISFCEKFIELDVPLLSSKLLCCFLEAKDFDRAFLCIRRCRSLGIQKDFVRSFVFNVLKFGGVSRLISFEYKEMTSFVVSELQNVSIGGLEASVSFCHSIGDASETAQSLYSLSRQLLRHSTVFQMRKSLSSAVLCLSIMKDNCTAVRDPCRGRIVKSSDVERLICRLRCALGSKDPIEASKSSKMSLLSLAVTGSSANFEMGVRCGFFSRSDISDFASQEIAGCRLRNLRRLLSADRSEWGYSVHEKCLLAFLHSESDPPVWFIDCMIEKCIDRLFELCCQFERRSVIFDAIVEAKERQHPISDASAAALRNFGVPPEILC